MNRKRLTKTLTLVFLFISSGSLVFAQDIDFSLNLRQKEFRVGEPVIVELRMINLRKEAIELQEPGLATQTLRFWIQEENKIIQQYRLNYVVENLPVLTLAPGETFRTEETIFLNYGKNTLAFPQEGEYTLKVEYLGFISTAKPSPAEILIKVIPNASSDKKWEEFFSQKETQDFLSQFSSDSNVFHQLESLIKKYPKSIFASYGRYYLAHQEASEHSGKSSNFEKAITWIKQTDVRGFQLQREALFYLAEWHWQLGRAEEALGYLDRLIQEFPGTPIAENATALKERWSTRKPPTPPKKIIPVQGKVKKEIEKTLKEYFTAFSKADLEGCLAKLDENFLYNDILNKEAMAEELKEDFNKFKQGTLKVNWELQRVEEIEGIVTADVQVSYVLSDQPSNSSLMHVEFAKKSKQWFLKTVKSR